MSRISAAVLKINPVFFSSLGECWDAPEIFCGDKKLYQSFQKPETERNFSFFKNHSRRWGFLLKVSNAEEFSGHVGFCFAVETWKVISCHHKCSLILEKTKKQNRVYDISKRVFVSLLMSGSEHLFSPEMFQLQLPIKLELSFCFFP